MLGLSLLLAIGLSTPSTDAVARERLDALIASTNALAHFHAEYASTGAGKQGLLTLDYRAPGHARIRGASSKGTVDSGLADSILWSSRERPGLGKAWARADLLDRGGTLEPVLALLRNEFWRPEPVPAVELGIAWESNQRTRRTEPAVSLQQLYVGGDGHAALLGWLHTLQHVEGPLAIEGDELVYSGEGVRCRVDLQTGFLEELILSTDAGVHLTLTLVRLDLESPPSDDVFAIPALEPGATDFSEAFQRPVLSRNSLRFFALSSVHARLEQDARALDDGVRGELERFFVALHDPQLLEDHAQRVADSQTSALEFAQWVRTSLQAGSSRESVLAAVAERRGSIEGTLKAARADVQAVVPADPERFEGSPHWRAIRALESDVLDRRFDDLLARPMLADFDARVAAALED